MTSASPLPFLLLREGKDDVAEHLALGVGGLDVELEPGHESALLRVELELELRTEELEVLGMRLDRGPVASRLERDRAIPCENERRAALVEEGAKPSRLDGQEPHVDGATLAAQVERSVHPNWRSTFPLHEHPLHRGLAPPLVLFALAPETRVNVEPDLIGHPDSSS